MKRGIAIGLTAAVVVAAAGIWFVFFRDDAPPELSLDDAVAAITATTGAASGEGDSTTTSPPVTDAPTNSTPPDATGLDGSWTVDQANTTVGYRIGEELSGIGASEAVGRTSQVSGSLTLNGSVIEAVAIEVDMTTLESDSGSRDDQLRTRGLETSSFPTATFVLTNAVDLGVVPGEGETVSVVASGDLTLHGVTRSVEIPLDGTMVEGVIVVVGSLDIALADYDIEPPTGFRVLSIKDEGVFEVQLAFTR